MEKTKDILLKNFESIVVIVLLITVATIHFLFENKFSFLNFYYLPVLLAGYYLGKKKAIFVGLASVMTVTLFVLTWPRFIAQSIMREGAFWPVFVWGSFLLLSAVLVGTLYEEKEKNIDSLKMAYIGVLEILSKYLESGDPYTRNHSVRVAELAVKIGKKMRLDHGALENIRVAALLHDIGKVEVSMDIINKSVSLTEKERGLINSHSKRGAELLDLAGSVLKQAVPLVESHHKFFSEGPEQRELPLGSRIIAVADSYDAMVSDRPYRAALPSWRALEEIKDESGHQFDPDVVEAFVSLLTNESEEQLLTTENKPVRV